MTSLFITLTFAIWLYMTAWYFICLYRKDNGLVDFAWGLGFVLIALHCFYWEGMTSRLLLIGAMTVVWGIRLASHIYLRSQLYKGKEDFRYARWREQWGDSWKIRSYFQVFMLQGFFMLLIALPIMAVARTIDNPIRWLDVVGVLVYAVGMYWETEADFQLYNFKSDPANKGKLMTEGLWKYSRHPNYFGEVVIWWGIYIVALSSAFPYISLISPLLITWLLMRVSGVPMLESKYKNNPEYRKYSEQTSTFFPKKP